MSKIVVKASISRALRLAMNDIDRGHKVDKLCVYKTGEEIYYKAFKEGEEIDEKDLLCDLTPLFTSYVILKQMSMTKATNEIHQMITKALDEKNSNERVWNNVTTCTK